MRHFTWLAAVAVAIFAIHAGAFTSKSAPLSVESLPVVSMDVLEMQKHIDYLPVMVIDNPV